MTPAASASHSRSRLDSSLIGGQHLNCVWPSPILLGRERQIVRAGLGRDEHTLGLRGRQQRHDLGAGHVQDVHPRPGLPGQLDHPGDGRDLGRIGPGGDEIAVSPAGRRARCGPRPPRARSAGCPARRSAAWPRQPGVVQRRELRHPGVDRKALEPEHARLMQPGQLAGVPGHRAAPEPDVNRALPSRGRPLDLECGASTVGGIEFSGMSMTVVTPPAAAAAVAVANPSQSVRPGSFTCTWLSTSPGSSTSSSPSTTSNGLVRRNSPSVQADGAGDGADLACPDPDLRRLDPARRQHPPRHDHQIRRDTVPPVAPIHRGTDPPGAPIHPKKRGTLRPARPRRLPSPVTADRQGRHHPVPAASLTSRLVRQLAGAADGT